MGLHVSRQEVSRLSVFALLNVASSLLAAEDRTNSPILANLSFDQLSQIKIVTVSQRLESLQDAPAAVHVVTSQDIADSGATSIPEALRNVPGLNVAQINGSSWAIGARGFQGQYANKLLVLEDGVSVYTPLFGGVWWEQQNYFLPDLEQIEVVLGPGGSIWGANAMNGVINIITKSARDTQGGEVYAGGGTENAAMAGARYGWLADTNVYARVYGIYSYDQPTVKIGGGDAPDATSGGQGGFRLDGYPRDSTQWTLKGDVRWAANESVLVEPDLAQPLNGYSFTNNAMSRDLGGQLLGHWQTELDAGSLLQAQAYYDYTQTHQAVSGSDVQTADVQLHHTWTGWQRQVIDWGVDGRMVYREELPGWVTFTSPQATEWLGSGFVQDEISLVPETLFLTAGLKLEKYSDVADFMPQPSVRLTWHPSEPQTIWAAWSRAFRSPEEAALDSELDAYVLPPNAQNPYPTVIRILGNPNLNPEQLQAWEIGWRWQACKTLTLDLASYYYQYQDLILYTATGAPASGYDPSLNAVVVPMVRVNGSAGDAYGGEIALTWRPGDRWFACANYSVRHTVLNSYVEPDNGFANEALDAPRQTVALTSGVDLGHNLELTGALRYLDNVPNYNVRAYWELDAQLSWRPSPHWKFSLAGQNLLHDQHLEYASQLAGQTAEIPRGVYAKVTWRF